MRRLLEFTAFIALSVSAAMAAPASEWAKSNPSWVTPVAPFRIAGNLYYVGTEGLGAFLIVGDQGHILIDGGLPENAPQILSSIETLGFQPKDVRILLNTHAHLDHSGGLAALKAATGAALYASSADRAALEGGFAVGHEQNPAYNTPPVVVDHFVADGETLRIGDISVTAALTPGHTPGCTSWWVPVEEIDRSLNALVFCSATVADNRLVPPYQYDGIVDAYRSTFAKTTGWAPDILLANHPVMFGMEAKRRALLAGERDAFVDATAFGRMVEALAARFEEELAGQQRAAGN